MIAHRLSTVKSANKIFALRDGQVFEEGTHDQLMEKHGLYYSLCMQQIQREKEQQQGKVCAVFRVGLFCHNV